MIPFLYFYIVIFLFGLVVGSFLNYVIYRLSIEGFAFHKNILGKDNRSYCPNCKHVLSWIDLFPIFSYFYLQGKCRYCKNPISLQYPAVEILTAVTFLFVLHLELESFAFFNLFNFWHLAFLLYIVCVLIIIFFYDLKHYLIPDKILFPAIALTLLYQLIFNHSFFLTNALWAAAGSFIFFTAIFLVSKGNWIGFGDCKFVVLMGFLLGFPSTILALFLAFLLGAIIGIIAIVQKKKEIKSALPFAPFLVTGTLIALFWGEKIMSWYIHLLIV